MDASQKGSVPSSVQKTDGKTPSLDGKDAKDAISTSSSGEPNKPSVEEILECTRSRFVEGTQEEWIALAVDAGFSEKGANSLFEKLKGVEVFWLVKPDGRIVWRWVSG